MKKANTEYKQSSNRNGNHFESILRTRSIDNRQAERQIFRQTEVN